MFKGVESLIPRRWWGMADLKEVHHFEEDAIEQLLLGRTVTQVADDHLLLDDGTLLKVVPNEGCSCSSGNYDLTHLSSVENIITKVEFDYEPTSDDDETGWTGEDGHYRIFVFAGDQRINLLQVDGTDGNGYYGTGYSLVVRRA